MKVRVLEYDHKDFSYNLAWNRITRNNDNSKTLSASAINLLGVLFDKLQKDDCVVINHDWISKVTHSQRRQNINLINQLKDIFQFTYYTRITVSNQNKTKRILRHCYTVRYTDDGLQRVLDSLSFYKSQ